MNLFMLICIGIMLRKTLHIYNYSCVLQAELYLQRGRDGEVVYPYIKDYDTLFLFKLVIVLHVLRKRNDEWPLLTCCWARVILLDRLH